VQGQFDRPSGVAQGVRQQLGGGGGPDQRRGDDPHRSRLLGHQADRQQPGLRDADRIEWRIEVALEAALAIPGGDAVPHQQQAARHRAAAERDAS
jgi:hypothetical protein